MIGEYPRCPFTTVGLQATSACPGFRPRHVPAERLPWFSPVTLPAGETCGHLHSQPGRRGFVTACHHPEGLPVGAEAVARRLAPPRRRR